MPFRIMSNTATMRTGFWLATKHMIPVLGDPVSLALTRRVFLGRDLKNYFMDWCWMKVSYQSRAEPPGTMYGNSRTFNFLQTILTNQRPPLPPPPPTAPMFPTRILLKRSIWKGRVSHLPLFPSPFPLPPSPTFPSQLTVSPRRTFYRPVPPPKPRPARARPEATANPHQRALVHHHPALHRTAVPGAQRQGLRRRPHLRTDGRTQVGGVCADEEEVFVQDVEE